VEQSIMSWLGQNVDLGWGATLIRLATGAFFLPHAYVKLPWPGTIAFFQAAGFKPPAFWMYVANAIEAAVALSLLSNVLVRYFGLLGAVHLLIAGGAVYRVNGPKWLWNTGGFEYCVFWAICCLAVAING
jgi:putative oxidoreductase